MNDEDKDGLLLLRHLAKSNLSVIESWVTNRPESAKLITGTSEYQNKVLDVASQLQRQGHISESILKLIQNESITESGPEIPKTTADNIDENSEFDFVWDVDWWGDNGNTIEDLLALKEITIENPRTFSIAQPCWDDTLLTTIIDVFRHFAENGIQWQTFVLKDFEIPAEDDDEDDETENEYDEEWARDLTLQYTRPLIAAARAMDVFKDIQIISESNDYNTQPQEGNDYDSYFDFYWDNNEDGRISDITDLKQSDIRFPRKFSIKNPDWEDPTLLTSFVDVFRHFAKKGIQWDTFELEHYNPFAAIGREPSFSSSYIRTLLFTANSLSLFRKICIKSDSYSLLDEDSSNAILMSGLNLNKRLESYRIGVAPGVSYTMTEGDHLALSLLFRESCRFKDLQLYRVHNFNRPLFHRRFVESNAH